MIRPIRIAVLCAALCAAGCAKESASSLTHTGITSQSWQSDNRCKASGQTLFFSFRASGRWQAECGASWCRPDPESGKAGTAILRVEVDPNATGSERSATVVLRVTGSSAQASFRIRQAGDDSELGQYTEVNEWVADYMSKNYLWNEPVGELSLDWSDDYDVFLRRILEGVAACKGADGRELNHDDGHWTDGRRDYFYSYIEGPEPASASALHPTRASDGRTTGTGVRLARCVRLTGTDRTIYGLAIYAIAPGSPAERAGLRRGMLVSRVDGETVTAANFAGLLGRLCDGPAVRVQLDRVVWDADGRFAALEPIGERELTAETYADPAVYRVCANDIGGKRVGYLLYMSFSSEDDQSLIEAFDGLRGADELILDLRYNGGGSVRSSTLLSTLIAGESRRDRIYCKLTYNARRTQAGESGCYRIGNREVPDGTGDYAPLETALPSALGLERVYVLATGATASASELVINGLRGMGIDVRLVGSRTNGKNVGMEGFRNRTVGGESYTFMPITFYSENALGFRDYGDGFLPDLAVDENHYPEEFATTGDACYAAAARWIRTGDKPAAQRAAARAPRSTALAPAGEPHSRGRAPRGSEVYLDR